MRYLALTFAIFFAVLTSTRAIAEELDLNILNNCSDLSALVALVQRAPTGGWMSCRAPQTMAEATVMQHLPSVPGSQTSCLLSSSPVQALRTFSCVLRYSVSPKFGSLTCFRPYSSLTIARLERQFKNSYKFDMRAYEDAISKCPVSDGDATAFPITVYPGDSVWLLKPKFIVGTGLGVDQPIAKGLALHGYGILSPILRASSGQSGAEFVYISYGGGTHGADQPPEIRPDRLVDIIEEPDDPGIKSWSKSYSESPLGKSIAFINRKEFDFYAGAKHALELEEGDKRTKILTSAATSVSKFLTTKGYVELSEADLFSAQSGLIIRSFEQMFDLNQPYGSYFKVQMAAPPRLFVMPTSRCGSQPIVADMVVIEAETAQKYTFGEIGDIQVFDVAFNVCPAGPNLSLTDIAKLLNKEVVQ